MTQMAHLNLPAPPAVIEFGPFRLVPGRRVLQFDGSDIAIGARALDLLAVLLRHAGGTVSHRDLMRAVWPGLVIEESSLRSQIKLIRRALSVCPATAMLVTNVPGRGYAFLGEVRATPPAGEIAAPFAALAQEEAPSDPALFGRSRAIEELCGSLGNSRIVSIVGAGGVGKTTVARAIAHQVEASFRDGVVFVSFSTATDAGRAMALLSIAFHQHGMPNSSLDEILALTKGRRMLVVLDCCEHVLETAAEAAHALLASGSGMRVLVTSREPLGLKDEWVHALPPLDLPDATPQTLAEAEEFPAVALFVERARHVMGNRRLADSDAAPIVELCRRLGGLPLSIEFAAARVDALGVREILARMDSSLELLTSNRQHAEPRHRSPRAVLEWSHALLDERQRTVFERLAAFSGAFTLEAGAAVASDDRLAPPVAMATILELARKSLLVSRVAHEQTRFEFVETTRLFALECLQGRPEFRDVRLRHAHELLRSLNAAGDDWQAIPQDTWRKTHGVLVDDLHGALDWLWSSEGDEQLAVRLTAAGLGLIYSLGLLHHDQAYVTRSLQVAQTSNVGADTELSLIIVLLSRGRTADPRGQPLLVQRALELSTQLQNPRAEIAARYVSWVNAFCIGDYAAAASEVARMSRLARRHEPVADVMRMRLSAQIHHFRGQNALARRLAEQVLRAPERVLPIGLAGPMPKAIVMRIMLARILWIQGEVADASEVADEAVYLSTEHPFAQTQALAMAACPIAFWRGDRKSAIQNVERLTEHTARLGSAYWADWVEGYKIALAWIDDAWEARALTGGTPAWGAISCRRALDEAEICAQGRPSPAFRQRAAPSSRLWCTTEVMRLEAEALRSRGLTHLGCESMLRAALKRARDAGELSWQLRAACSLGSLLADQGDTGQAARLVQETYDRFRQGLDTRDLRTARSMLDRLCSSPAEVPRRLSAA